MGKFKKALFRNRLEMLKTYSLRRRLLARLAASFLLSHQREHPVFRTAVLWIVMTLAAGQNAALLCSTWCDAHALAASACHHLDPASGTTVGAADDCCKAALSSCTIAFLREDVRLGVSSAVLIDAIPASPSQPAHSTIDARQGQSRGRDWSHEKRPLPTALRL